MVNVAIDAIKNTDVSKVIILERIPRFDRTQDDPPSIKKELSELANSHLHYLLQKSGYKSKIIIGSHNLNNHISDYYGDVESFDGIHLRGLPGQYAYTKSIIGLLNECGAFLSSSSSSSTSSSRFSIPTTSPLITSNPKKYSDDHTNCPQARYQRSKSKPSRSSLHAPVFLSRGSIRDFYYSRNIFDTLNSVSNSGN